MNRWVVENKLDKLKFARQKLAYCYFSAAATITSPELCDARLSWAKNGVLTTVVDDFFDVGGSEEELVNLIQLVEKYFSFPSTISPLMLFVSVSFSCSFCPCSILYNQTLHILINKLQVGC